MDLDGVGVGTCAIPFLDQIHIIVSLLFESMDSPKSDVVSTDCDITTH